MHYKKWTRSVLTMFCLIFLTDQAMANLGETHTQTLASGEMEVSAFITTSETDYDGDDNDEITIERKSIGLSLSRGITEKVNVFGSIGYIWEGDLDLGSRFVQLELDSGYYLSAGARYMAYQSGQFSCHLYGKLDYTINETYSDNGRVTIRRDGRLVRHRIKADGEIDGYEVMLGSVANYAINEQFSIYGGLSFALLEGLNGEVKARFTNPDFETLSASDDGDLDRDSRLGIKLGGHYNINQTLAVNAEANFMGETAYLVNISKKF